MFLAPGAAAAAGPEEHGRPAIRVVFDADPASPDFGGVAVLGVPAQMLEWLRGAGLDAPRWSELLALYTGERPRPGQPAIVGRYAIEDGALRFRPRFTPVAGLSGVIRFDGPRLARISGIGMALPRLEEAFRVPEPDAGPTPHVVAVYPSGVVLPENTLRLYVHFSAPMRARGVQRHVRLETADGTPVEVAFVEIDGGLWDPAQTRLTLFFHPGRVKREVGPNLAMGPPLVAGRRYRLVVDGALADASGRPLGTDFVHEFAAGPADRGVPDREGLRVVPPRTPTAPVSLDLPEPLDQALLLRLVGIVDRNGRPVAGRTDVGPDETRWSFVPEQPWGLGDYRVALNTAIEDRAGNSFERPFEVSEDADAAAGPAGRSDVIELPFRVAGPGE